MNEPGLRVLVVDDEQAIRRYLSTVLNAAGYTICAVPDGKSALNECVRFRPDLVILDLGLPDMDGLEVLRQMREYMAVPIIILSARKMSARRCWPSTQGPTIILQSHSGTCELLARLRVVMRRPSSSRRRRSLPQTICESICPSAWLSWRASKCT